MFDDVCCYCSIPVGRVDRVRVITEVGVFLLCCGCLVFLVCVDVRRCSLFAAVVVSVVVLRCYSLCVVRGCLLLLLFVSVLDALLAVVV